METQEQRRVFDNQMLWVPGVPQQRAQWVKTLVEAIRKIEAGEQSRYVNTVFWIRLWGVLVELRDSFSGAAPSDGGSHVSRAAAERAQVVAARISQVAESLSDEELLWVDYRRHNETHVEQRGFRLQIKADGNVKDQMKPKTLDRVMSIDDIDRTLMDFYQEYGDEFRIAEVIAAKVRKPAHHLYSAIEEWRILCLPVTERARDL